VPIQCLPLNAMLVVKNGQKEEEALNSITITAAEFCGIEKRVGSISVGKDADLVIFKNHPFYHAFEEPQYVFINGRKVVDFNAAG
ncbi:MAG: amidohydrolase family protein, partial [Oscillospiraceae bacterium]